MNDNRVISSENSVFRNFFNGFYDDDDVKNGNSQYVESNKVNNSVVNICFVSLTAVLFNIIYLYNIMCFLKCRFLQATYLYYEFFIRKWLFKIICDCFSVLIRIVC